MNSPETRANAGDCERAGPHSDAHRAQYGEIEATATGRMADSLRREG